MKYNWLKEDEIEGLRKVQDENGEDLYMTADVKVLDDAKRDSLRIVVSGAFMRQLREQTGVIESSGN